MAGKLVRDRLLSHITDIGSKPWKGNICVSAILYPFQYTSYLSYLQLQCIVLQQAQFSPLLLFKQKDSYLDVNQIIQLGLASFRYSQIQFLTVICRTLGIYYYEQTRKTQAVQRNLTNRMTTNQVTFTLQKKQIIGLTRLLSGWRDFPPNLMT